MPLPVPPRAPGAERKRSVAPLNGTLLATKTYVLTCYRFRRHSASAKATVTYIDLDDDGD